MAMMILAALAAVVVQ